MKQTPHPKRLDYKTLNDNYRVRITNKFAPLLLYEEEKSADDLWNAGKEIIIQTAAETVDKKTKKITNWISDETLEEVKIRREIKSKGLDNPVFEALYRNQNAKIQRMTRRDKEKFIEQQLERCSRIKTLLKRPSY